MAKKKEDGKGSAPAGKPGKGKGKTDGDDKDSKAKGAQSINVRHILVRLEPLRATHMP